MQPQNSFNATPMQPLQPTGTGNTGMGMGVLTPSKPPNGSAKAAAANAVIDGWKTVEMIQAFALWSVYNPPARRWEEDRAWCYTGIAFRCVCALRVLLHCNCTSSAALC